MDFRLKKTVVILSVICLLCSFLFVLPVKSPSTSVLSPTNDSWIEAEFPAVNHGSDTSLRVRADSRTSRSYLQFDLNSIPSGKTLTSAKLYLYCTYSDFNPSVQIYVHETGDGWGESSITWNNAPAVGSLVTSISVGGTCQYYCWDITSYAQTQYSGDKVLSVVAKLLFDDPTQNNPNYARYFASKEYSGLSKDPYLEVNYENTSPTALFTHTPSYPVANDTVTFDASASYDPDGTIATYSWDFGDGNVTTVTTATVGHEYVVYDNYTVILTVTDNDGLSNSCSNVVEVVDPQILRVSLPEGTWIKQNTGDPWIDEGWLLNKTGVSWSFTVKIYDTSCSIDSYDTHVVVALNNASYDNLVSLTINGTSIPKSAFKYGKPGPYNIRDWPTGCVYPTWFNDTYINVGKISAKTYKILTVSVTYSNATGARMHFDAYGSVSSCQPHGWTWVTWSPNGQDSTVMYQAGPSPLSASISPTSATIDLGQQVSFSSSVSGGTLPYSYQWYSNGSAIVGANMSSLVFTPTSVGYYQVHLNVTDAASTVVKSNVAGVTVNSALSVSISPVSSTIILGQSVSFSSTVTGGTLLYVYQWYLDDLAVSGANSSSWIFTPSSTGYYLVSLKVTDSASAVVLSSESDVTVNPKTYTLTIVATAGGTTNPATGTYTYNEGMNVQVSAAPDMNYKFVYWELDGAYNGAANPTTVTMNMNHTLKAVFAMITYTLTITTTAGGTTDPAPGTYTYGSGTSVNVTALPSANYLFDHWVLDGSNSGSVNPLTVQMNGNHTLQAVFALINYTLTITATAGGTTNPVPGTYIYASGSSVSVVAVPSVNYKFIHWELDGSNVTDNFITVLMNSNHTLNAVFKLLTYRLTILSSSGGVTDPSPGTWVYTNGTTVNVAATPNAYYVLDHWLLDGNAAGSANPFSILMMDDHTLQPVFAHVNYTLTISATIGGSTDPAPGAYTYSGGTTVAVNALPSSGYRFDHWVFDSSPTGSVNPINILMNSSHTLQAVFAETHTLVISASAGGTTNPAPGTYTYDNPTNVTVQAIPNPNYRFDHWMYDDVNVGSQTTITVYVGSGHSLQAMFSLINYTLTITSTAGGTTNPAAGTYTYASGTTANVSASANSGYVFDHWMLDGSPAGSSSTISVLMTGNRTLQAVFTQITYQLKIEAGTGGTTNPVPGTYTYASGSSVQVTASSSSGYVLDHWELNGSNVGSANPYTVVMSQNYVLRAVFKLSSVPPAVSITPPSASVLLGESVAFTSSASGGVAPYSYQWYLNGNPVSGATSSTFVFTPATGGTHSVYLKITDSNSANAQSLTSQVTVTSVPVGGFVVPSARHSATAPTLCYALVLVALCAVMCRVRRKRK